MSEQPKHSDMCNFEGGANCTCGVDEPLPHRGPEKLPCSHLTGTGCKCFNGAGLYDTTAQAEPSAEAMKLALAIFEPCDRCDGSGTEVISNIRGREQREECPACYGTGHLPITSEHDIARALDAFRAAGVAEEREACAKIATDIPCSPRIAAAIRARGTTGGGK